MKQNKADALAGRYYVHREYNSPLPTEDFSSTQAKKRKKYKKLRTQNGDELMKKEIRPVRFVVDGLLPIGLSIVAGKRKEGKSWLILDMCFSVAAGEKFFDHDTEQGTVLYLDLEDPETRLIQRAHEIRDVIPSKFHEATKAAKLDRGLSEQIKEFVKEHPDTNLIVIDTLQKIRKPKGDTYAGDYDAVSKLKSLADKLNIAVVCIHHTRKMKAKDTFDSVLGSTGLTAAADGIYVLERHTDGKPYGNLSFISRDMPDGEIPVRFDHDTCRWYPITDSEIEMELLYSDEAMAALIDFIKRETIFEGTATELSDQLSLHIGANNLTAKLSKYEKSLRRLGIEYTKDRHKTQRLLTVIYTAKNNCDDETMISPHPVEIIKSA